MRTEGPDFLARQVVAMIEEMGAEAIGAELCPSPSHSPWNPDLPPLHEVESQEFGCIGCGAIV